MDFILPVQLLSPAAVPPRRLHAGDAAYDIHCLEAFTVQPGDRLKVATGIAIALPPQTVGLLKGRSGFAARNGIAVLGGVIDSGFRGEIAVTLLNTGAQPFSADAGERIAQMLVQPILTPAIEVVDCLPESPDGRGDRGHGSTGR